MELPAKARRLYKDMEREMFLSLECGTEVEAFNAASKTIKCLQLANGAIYTDDTCSAFAEIHDAKLQALEDVIEEAAGITHYKARRAETLRRLEETQRNLQRVQDILEELRPRLASLRRQATRTRNFEQISADLRELLRVWYGYKWEQTKAELRTARHTADTATTVWSTARDALLAQQTPLRRRPAPLPRAASPP